MTKNESYEAMRGNKREYDARLLKENKAVVLMKITTLLKGTLCNKL